MHFFDPAQQVHPPGAHPSSPKQARTMNIKQHTSAGHASTSSQHAAPRSSGNPSRSHSHHGRSPSTSRTSAYPAQAPIIAAPHQSRSVSGSQVNVSIHNPKSNVQVTHGNRPGEIYMPEGVVDMAAFGQILALDETDPTREFSKALVWSWCDQAELAVEEMELFLEAGEIVPMADKAHYLKGSSSSLGLLKVAQTCQSIYHIHFPPSLAHARAMSYAGNHGAQNRGNSDDSTGSSGSGSSSAFSSFGGSSSSSSSSASPSPFVSSYASDSSASSVDQERSSSNESLAKSNGSSNAAPLGQLRRSSVEAPPAALARAKFSPRMDQQPSHYFQPRAASFGSDRSSSAASGSASPATQARDTAAHFEEQKLERAKSRLETLKREIREASEWLYAYYLESDKFAGVQSA